MYHRRVGRVHVLISLDGRINRAATRLTRLTARVAESPAGRVSARLTCFTV